MHENSTRSSSRLDFLLLDVRSDVRLKRAALGLGKEEVEETVADDAEKRVEPKGARLGEDLGEGEECEGDE